MERETGLEPATSSLGIFTSIDFKEHGAYRDAYRPKQNTNPDNRPSKPPLIGELMESSSASPFPSHRGMAIEVALPRLAGALTSDYTPN